MGDFLDFIDDNDSGSETEEEEDEERNKQSRVGIFNKSVPELLANRPTSCGVSNPILQDYALFICSLVGVESSIMELKSL